MRTSRVRKRCDTEGTEEGGTESTEKEFFTEGNEGNEETGRRSRVQATVRSCLRAKSMPRKSSPVWVERICGVLVSSASGDSQVAMRSYGRRTLARSRNSQRYSWVKASV